MWLRDLFRNRTRGTASFSLGGVEYDTTTNAGITIDPDKAIQDPTVYSCVNLSASVISQLPHKVIRVNANGEEEAVSSYDSFLRSPSTSHTEQEFKFACIVDKLMYGNTFWEILRNGGTVQLRRLNPTDVTVNNNPAGYPVYEVRPKRGDEPERNLRWDQVFHLRDFSVSTRGFSRVELCADLVALSYAADRWASGGFRRGDQFSGVITSEEGWDQTEVNEFIAAWESKYGASGASSASVAVLPGGWSWNERTKTSPADMKLIEQQKQTIMRIAGIFGVPPVMIGVEGNNAYTSVSQQQTSFYRDSISTHVKTFEEKLAMVLDLDENEYVRFDVSDLLKGDIRNSTEVANSAVMAGWMTPNEAREMNGLAPMEDSEADALVKPNGGDVPSMDPSQADGTPSQSNNNEGDANAQPNNGS